MEALNIPTGTLLWFIALILLPFSALDPLLLRLKLKRTVAALIFALGAAASMLPRTEPVRDLFIAPVALFMLAAALFMLPRMRSQRARGFAAANVGAMLAFGFKMFVPFAPAFEPGLLFGLAAAAGALITGKYLKARLFGAMLAPVIAEAALNVQSYIQLGFTELSLFGPAFSDAAAISLFVTAILAMLSQRRAAGRLYSRT